MLYLRGKPERETKNDSKNVGFIMNSPGQQDCPAMVAPAYIQKTNSLYFFFIGV